MAMRFRMLGSSSAGNSGLLETEQTRILIDAGFSGRKLEGMLNLSGVTPEQLQAVFLSHEHSDHISGLRGLARHPHLEFFATYGTATAAQKPLKRDLKWRLFEAETTFTFRDLEVTALRIPHDAYDPVGFIFRSGGDSLFNPRRSVAWLTDLGYVPEHLHALVRDVDLLVLEANHDLALLDADEKRPFSVKQRIRGRHGHLSNEAARDFLDTVASPRWSHVHLVHLSRDCNCIQKVRTLFEPHRTRFQLDIIDPDAGPGPWIDLI